MASVCALHRQALVFEGLDDRLVAAPLVEGIFAIEVQGAGADLFSEPQQGGRGRVEMGDLAVQERDIVPGEILGQGGDAAIEEVELVGPVAMGLPLGQTAQEDDNHRALGGRHHSGRCCRVVADRCAARPVEGPRWPESHLA